jgi:hypothetical protein
VKALRVLGKLLAIATSPLWLPPLVLLEVVIIPTWLDL